VALRLRLRLSKSKPKRRRVWQVHAVDLDGSEAEVLYETDHHIADLECGEWGLACLLREAKYGVVAEIGTGTVGSVVVVRP
jgi:hypothetical protein